MKQYDSKNKKEILAKRRVIAGHFGLRLNEVSCDIQDDTEQFFVKLYDDNEITIECVHVESDTFKDLGYDTFNKLIGNNYYFFRLM